MEIFVICATALLIVSGVLFFLDRHLTHAKRYRIEIESKFNNTMNEVQRVRDEASDAITKAEKFYRDLELINQNQINLHNELSTIKNRNNLQGGLMNLGRNNPYTPIDPQ